MNRPELRFIVTTVITITTGQDSDMARGWSEVQFTAEIGIFLIASR